MHFSKTKTIKILVNMTDIKMHISTDTQQ